MEEIKLIENKIYNKVKIIFIIFVCLFLKSCFSDGTFFLERSAAWHYQKKTDFDKLFNLYNENEIDSVFLRIYTPINTKLQQKTNLIKKHFEYNYTSIEFNYSLLDSFCNVKVIKLNKNDCNILKNDFRDYGLNLIYFKNKVKESGYKLQRGYCSFTNGLDTNSINSKEDEFYYFGFFWIQGHLINESLKLNYSSEIYQNEILINCFDNKSAVEIGGITFSRAVPKEFTYKLINAILDYKNKQIDLQNDSLKLLNKPLIEKYTWYKGE